MGVLTTAYSMPPNIIRKIRRDHELLEKFLEGESDWKIDSYDFDKAWEEMIKIIGAAGYKKTRAKLHTENHEDFSTEHDIWIVTPTALKAVVKEIGPATFEELKTKGIEQNVTDYYGNVIPEGMYSYYVGDIKNFKKFLKKAADAGNYLLFAEA